MICGDLERDFEVDLEGDFELDLEGDSKGDFRQDFKQDFEGVLLSSSGKVQVRYSSNFILLSLTLK